MTFSNKWLWSLLFLVALGTAAVVSGCGKVENVEKPIASDGDSTSISNNNSISQAPAAPAVESASFKIDQRFKQPFLAATLHEPPDGQLRPPETTMGGKSVGKLYELVAGKNGVGGEWDKVEFVSESGQRIQYTAKLDTDLGSITMELWPEVAPNHVRNFVALARVGYYDGLCFDRIVKQAGDAVEPRLELISAGCPLGTGEAGYGSIGYWLKPEVSDKVTHEPGTVGAWHGDVLDSAACKFYITLCKAPFMDGYWSAFGKVTSGLDLARTILDRPRREGLDRPADAVIIRKVTVTARVGGAI